jgi:hypothetical protein
MSSVHLMSPIERDLVVAAAVYTTVQVVLVAAFLWGWP